MNTSKQAFTLSLTFHSLMALTALWILTGIHSQTTSFALPIKHITIVSLSQLSKIVSPPTELAQPLNQKPTPETPKPKIAEPIKPILQKAINPLASTPILPTATPIPSIIIPSPEETKTNISPLAVKMPSQNPVKATHKIDINAEKQSFLAYLRTKIQQNLHYPSAARRRGMEGEVLVRFSLSEDGSIRSISVQRGEDIFHNAATTAVASSSGVNIPKNLTDSLPMEIELILEFTLNS